METRLEPIEKPQGFLMQLAYRLTRRSFGKVLSPLKVVYARLPIAFALFSSKISKLDSKLSISDELTLLLRTLIAQINICSFCIDIGKSIAIRKRLNSEKLYQVSDYQHNNLFNEAEKAALAFAEELTKNKSASDVTFDKLKSFYDERQLCEIAWVIATEHYYNLTNLAFNVHSDNLCDIGQNKTNKADVLA